MFADLTTSPPAAKASRDELATNRGRAFVDVALMAPVPGRGLATPALASGPGAERYAAALRRSALQWRSSAIGPATRRPASSSAA